MARAVVARAAIVATAKAEAPNDASFISFASAEVPVAKIWAKLEAVEASYLPLRQMVEQ